MNRLQYWIAAQTQYELHSPFLFDMYRAVLFAELSRKTRQRLRRQASSRADMPYVSLLYKLSDHYRLTPSRQDSDCTVLQASDPEMGTFTVVRRPHRSAEAEQQWQQLMADPQYRVSIDLFDAGLLLTSPRLHPQHFLLK